MAAQVVEDDTYSDDDLDALPANAFHQLQEDAFRSTQHQPDPPRQRLPDPSKPTAYHALTSNADLQHHSSDYGDFEDEMLDGEIIDGAAQPGMSLSQARLPLILAVGESTQREEWRQQRYSAGPSVPRPLASRIIAAPSSDGGAAAKNASRETDRRMTDQKAGYVQAKSHGGEIGDSDPLQRQIRILQRRCEALERATQAAKRDSFSKDGEIAIVRANASKIEKDFDIRTRTMQRAHQDEVTRQRMELERARAELMKITTEREFLKNDVAEGTKQIKQLQLAAKKGGDQRLDSKNAKKASPLSTPRKNKTAYGDGFEDSEVQPLSPSELALRAKGGTPKAGAKRKRKMDELSPVKPLDLVQPPPKEALAIVENSNENSAQLPPRLTHASVDVKFDFIQKLLGHRTGSDKDRTIERLAHFKLPSQSDKNLSTLLYDRILAINMRDVDNLPAAVGLAVISLWSQCMPEHYHEPVHLFTDFIQYILISNPLKTAPDLTNSLMDLIQETADVIIIPRCQKKPARTDTAEISSLDCLHVMQLMAQDCSIDTEEITRFWRTLRFDFIMMLLSFVHPVEEIGITVALLSTSILQRTFAMIIPPGDGKQDVTEARVVDNLSRLLVESPRPTQGEIALDPAELADLRLQILDLMNAMCESTYGAEVLAKHRLVIGRLVRVMNDELDRAYDHRYGWEKRIELVNESTRLLYRLTQRHAHLIDMQARLSVIPGGEKKYLIALTRLAFSEGGYLEDGIEDDVSELAQSMLEMSISPEEGDQLMEAFASAQSMRRESREAG